MNKGSQSEWECLNGLLSDLWGVAQLLSEIRSGPLPFLCSVRTSPTSVTLTGRLVNARPAVYFSAMTERSSGCLRIELTIGPCGPLELDGMTYVRLGKPSSPCRTPGGDMTARNLPSEADGSEGSLTDAA